jgi:hypothetical protein
MFSLFFQIKNFLSVIIFSVALLLNGCTAEAAKENPAGERKSEFSKTSAPTEPKNPGSKATIKIESNSPADTVRVFYKNLREKKFREAMFLTNLRPAVEGLTDAELKELHVDFEPLAAQVPPDIEINGEIISKDKATVTARLPDNDTDEIKLQEIRLRRENGVWVILTVDERAESEVEKEGKNYFTALRIKTHHEEAKAMLERVNKAQMVYATQNGGLYADASVLIDKGFLPKDFLTAETTGYNYQIQISPDRKKYVAAATPAVYGKTGKLSFWFETNGNKTSTLKNRDGKGQALKM